jgi:hypothetical protein
MDRDNKSKKSDVILNPVPDDFNKAMEDQDIPKTYINGFTCILGIGDFAILFKRNDKAVEVMNMSYTLAKTLAIKIHQLVQHLEDKSQHSIMTTDDLNEFLK